MAIRKMTEGVSLWNNKTPFPKDRYALTCIEESLEISKESKNPMIKRTWEITSPETAQLGDKTITVAGLKITTYRVTKVHAEDGESWHPEKSDKCFGQLRDELVSLGHTDDSIDDENPPLIAKGKTVDAIVYAREDVARKAPTAEQLRKGVRVGDSIKNADGSEVKTYQLQIESILGLASKQVGTPY